jgi:Gpi18-like mannosyltransferase
MVIGYVLYLGLSLWSKKKHAGLIAAGAFLFNPAVIYNSALWGQMDSVNNVWFVLSLYLLLQKRYMVSVAMYACSLLTKSSLSIMLPLYAWFVGAGLKWNMKALLTAACVFLGVFGLGILPVSDNPWSWYGQFLGTNATGEMDNVTAFAYNLWWVIFHPTLAMGASNNIAEVVNIWLEGSPLIQTMYGVFSLGAIAFGVSAIFQLPVYIAVVRKNIKLTPTIMYAATAALAIICYLTLPKMHERYMYPAWAPLAALIGLGVPLAWESIALMMLNLVNLFIVWHPQQLPIGVFDTIRNPALQWWIAVFTTVVGLWTAWKLMRSINQSL